MAGKRCLMRGVVICLLLAVCVTPFVKASAEQRTEIIVGAINNITGIGAMNGVEHGWAYQEAVNDINKRGGVYVKELNKKLPIKLIFADDKTSPDQGAAAMERLIRVNKIDLALSSQVTPINIAAATVCEKYKVYFQTVITWLDFVEKEHFRYVSDLFTSAAEAGRAPWETWKNLPSDQRPKRPALMTEDNQDGQGFGDGMRGFAKEYGYTFAVDEPYTPGSKDFSSIITKWKVAKVDALLWLGSPADGITLVRQMKEQELRLPYVMGTKGLWPHEFEQALGKDSNYIIHDGFWSEKSGAPGAKELGERYKKKFGRDSVSIGLSYANVQILAMAIEKAGSFKSEKVRDAVFGGEFKATMMGDVKYNEKGLAFTPLLAMQWWNGERMPVYPANPKLWTVKPAPTSW